MRGRRRRDDEWGEASQDGLRDNWPDDLLDDWTSRNRSENSVRLDPPGFAGAPQAGPGAAVGDWTGRADRPGSGDWAGAAGYQSDGHTGFGGADRGPAGNGARWQGEQPSGVSPGGSQGFGDAIRGMSAFDGPGQGFGDPGRVVRGLDRTRRDPDRGGPAFGPAGHSDAAYRSAAGQGFGPGYAEPGYSSAGNPGPAHSGYGGGASGYGASGYGEPPSPSYGYGGSGFGDSGFGGAGQSGGHQDTGFGPASYGFGETSPTAQYGRMSPAQLTSGQGPDLADGEYAVSDWGATANGSAPATPRPYGRLSIFTLLEDKAAEFDRMAALAAEGVRTGEPDTLVYVIHVVPKAPMQRIIYEIYRDRAAFESHERQTHIQRFAADRRACVLATNIIDLRLKYAKVAALGTPAAASPAEEAPSAGAPMALESATRAPSFSPHGSAQHSAVVTGGYAESGGGRAMNDGGGRYAGSGPDRPAGSQSRAPWSPAPARDQPSYQGGRYGGS